MIWWGVHAARILWSTVRNSIVEQCRNSEPALLFAKSYTATVLKEAVHRAQQGPSSVTIFVPAKHISQIAAGTLCPFYDRSSEAWNTKTPVTFEIPPPSVVPETLKKPQTLDPTSRVWELELQVNEPCAPLPFGF